MEESSERECFVEPVGMNGSNLKNETLFVPCGYRYHQKWVYISYLKYNARY